jgi:KUP system potassium uptake protein
LQVDLRFGFLDDPDVPAALGEIDLGGAHFNPASATYFLGRESVRATRGTGMNPLRERLFIALNRSASSAARFFSLPADRVFEIGSFVEI